MSLEEELGLRKPIILLGHKALLSTYYTASQLKKRGGEFFRPFNLTDVQFNLMMLLEHQAGPDEGLSQAQLSNMMLVNPANITSLIDRMEKAGLVARTSAPTDRRYNIIKLTPRGKGLLDRAEPLYTQEVNRIMGALEQAEQEQLVEMLERVRDNINQTDATKTGNLGELLLVTRNLPNNGVNAGGR